MLDRRSAGATMMDVWTARAESRGKWLDAWRRTGREPFAHPEYVALFADADDETLAVGWTDPAGGEALLPLVLRPVPSELTVGSISSSHPPTDLISPYGYGGPFAVGNVDWRAFYASVLEWMRSEGVVTGFVRTVPTDDTPLELPLEGYVARHVADNIVVSLARSNDEQWSHYAHKVRKNVKKARRADLHVEIRSDLHQLDDFVEIYSDTMKRRNADDWYFFGRQLFERIATALPGGFRMASVLDPSGRVVSIELVLASDRYLYSFLGGTRSDAFPHAPNDLLKHAVITHGREAGHEGYVLGGGYEPNDGIFRYKRSFDVDGRRPFVAVQLTADAEYDRFLTGQRVARIERDEPGSALSSDFFPAYRAPSIPQPRAEPGGVGDDADSTV